MGNQTQTCNTPKSTGGDKPNTVTERANRESQSIRHRMTVRRNTKTRITIAFKGNMPTFGAVLRTKDENYKVSIQNLQENVLQYVAVNYNK